MQGELRGSDSAEPGRYEFGFRGRMDERYDCVRSCGDGRFVYLRQFMPHKIYGQHIAYMFETPTTRIWKKLYDEGKLKPPMTYFWETKPYEELYDLQSDRWETRNLARSPEHQDKLKELRTATLDWMKRVRDVGILPEYEVHKRSEGSTPYDMARTDDKYPMERVLAAALAASDGYGTGSQPPVDMAMLKDADSAVRYWTVMGILMRGEKTVAEHVAAVRESLKDPAPNVRIAAAEALGCYGKGADVNAALETLLELAPMDVNGLYLSLAALGAIDAMGKRAKPALARIEALPTKQEGLEQRLTNYVPAERRHRGEPEKVLTGTRAGHGSAAGIDLHLDVRARRQLVLKVVELDEDFRTPERRDGPRKLADIGEGLGPNCRRLPHADPPHFRLRGLHHGESSGFRWRDHQQQVRHWADGGASSTWMSVTTPSTVASTSPSSTSPRADSHSARLSSRASFSAARLRSSTVTRNSAAERI